MSTTTAHVTHDQVGYTQIATAAVLKDGAADTPRAPGDDPVNTFVATFIGAPAMNLIDAATLTVWCTGIWRYRSPTRRPSGCWSARPESWDVASIGTLIVDRARRVGWRSRVSQTLVYAAGRPAGLASRTPRVPAPTGGYCGAVVSRYDAHFAEVRSSSRAAPRPGC